MQNSNATFMPGTDSHPHIKKKNAHAQSIQTHLTIQKAPSVNDISKLIENIQERIGTSVIGIVPEDTVVHVDLSRDRVVTASSRISIRDDGDISDPINQR